MIPHSGEKARGKNKKLGLPRGAPRGPRADSPPARVAKLGTKKRKAQKGRFRPLGSLLEALHCQFRRAILADDLGCTQNIVRLFSVEHHPSNLFEPRMNRSENIAVPLAEHVVVRGDQTGEIVVVPLKIHRVHD